jgi:hypothetical protein
MAEPIAAHSFPAGQRDAFGAWGRGPDSIELFERLARLLDRGACVQMLRALVCIPSVTGVEDHAQR